MKILISSNSTISSAYGGGEVYIRNLISSFSGGGHCVIGMSLTFTDVEEPQRLWFRHDNFEEVQLALPKSWQIGSVKSNSIIRETSSLAKDIAPDIIHAHGWKDIVAQAAKQAGIHCVVTAHHGGIVCPAGALLNADDEICRIPASDNHCLKCCTKSVPGWRLWYPLLRAIPLRWRLCAGERLRRLPFVLFLTPLGTVSCSILDKLQSVRTIGLNADRVIAPSPAIADALVRNGIPANKVVVVPHGIPLPERQPLRPDMGKGSVRFLYVGRISYVKGVHVLLEAFSGLPSKSYELHIAGGAVTKPERRYLAKLQAKYASVHVTWHGHLSHDEIPLQIAACDAVVHPAICLEIYGLTIAEALAVGRPVIASRCGGAEAQIRDGENGLLVPPNDAAALRQAIQTMINNPVCLQTMANKSGDVVSIKQHIKVLEKVYAEAIDGVAAKG